MFFKKAFSIHINRKNVLKVKNIIYFYAKQPDISRFRVNKGTIHFAFILPACVNFDTALVKQAFPNVTKIGVSFKMHGYCMPVSTFHN